MSAIPKKKLGRPTKLTPQIQDEICERIAYGESLRAILKSNPKFPEKKTILKALREDEEFRTQYARAREDQADTLAEEILEIADSATGENAHAIRVRVDARKWVASKLRPKVYGNSLALTAADGRPLSGTYRDLTDQELDAEIARRTNAISKG